MSLELVSLTGADDCVAPESLAALSEQYPFAEWAILFFPEKEGTPRNPSGVWREKFLALKLPYTAAHLCGTQVFRELLDPVMAQSLIADLSRYRRIQLNINARRPEFTDEEVLAIAVDPVAPPAAPEPVPGKAVATAQTRAPATAAEQLDDQLQPSTGQWIQRIRDLVQEADSLEQIRELLDLWQNRKLFMQAK